MFVMPMNSLSNHPTVNTALVNLKNADSVTISRYQGTNKCTIYANLPVPDAGTDNSYKLAEIDHLHSQEIAVEVCSYLITQFDGLRMDPIIALVTEKVEKTHA